MSRRFLVNETSRAQNTNSGLDLKSDSVRWGGSDFGSVLAEDVGQNYIYMLSLTKLPHTALAPLVLGILESDNHNSSFEQQQIKKLHTYVYRNIRMIALRGSILATSYHDICRIKHRRTGIDDQTFDYDLLA